MPSATTVRFSVRWTGPYRRMLIGWLVFFALVTVGWLYVTWNPEFTKDAGEQGQLAGLWMARGMVAVFVAPFLLLLGLVRLAIWLDADALVRQGALWRRRIRLGRATFDLTETSWDYTRRFGAVSFARVKITAPTLVVRASRVRRIKLPLVRRAGHEIVGGRVVVAWLAPAELDPLADAIDRYATAPNKETVANYLRNVTRSAVQPSGHLGGLP